MSTLQLSTKVPVLPVVRLDVSQAPVIRLLSSKGAVEQMLDVSQGLDNKSIMQLWSTHYSIIYPSDTDWEAFWSAHKGYM